MSDGLKMKYFVLKPAGDDAYAAASRAAMLKYAAMIERENKQFAAEVKKWASRENAEAYARSVEKADA